jgi:hypothetical protein
MRVPDPRLSQHLALALRTQESRVRQHDAANARGELTRNHRRSHASHRMAHQNRRRESESLDECNRIAGVILVSISLERRAPSASRPVTR